jgi:hypothetical protein
VFVERAARETIGNGTMRASARLLELLDASSKHVSLDASKHIGGAKAFPRRGIVKSANQGDGKSLSVALPKRFSLPRPSGK